MKYKCSNNWIGKAFCLDIHIPKLCICTGHKQRTDSAWSIKSYSLYVTNKKKGKQLYTMRAKRFALEHIHLGTHTFSE